MRCAVALSGGVDSAVAAFLLKEAGEDVLGVTARMRTGAEGDRQSIAGPAAFEENASSVAAEIGIPHEVIDLSDAFKRLVRDYFVHEYSSGRTPNPCVRCNSVIKFGLLMDEVLRTGCAKMATGHYVRKVRKSGRYFLAEAADKRYDQSYFLCGIKRVRLGDLEFPLAEMTKRQVERLAREKGFSSVGSRSSQDICFAGLSGDYREYLAAHGKDVFRPGSIVDMDGRVLGRHDGIASYTVGQRRGLGLSMGDPVYVTEIDPVTETVRVGRREQAMRSFIRVGDINWFTDPLEGGVKDMDVRIRYNSPAAKAEVDFVDGNKATVRFSEPQFAPAPGQAAVFYQRGMMLCGGWIEDVPGRCSS